MTTKLSLIAAIVGAALLVVPAAWSQDSPDAFERAVAAKQAQQDSTAATMPDVFERAVAARSTTGRTLVFDSYRNDPKPTTDAKPVSSGSGRDIEWPQVGVGFAIGILLALGLVLAARGVRIRPLAH